MLLLYPAFRRISSSDAPTLIQPCRLALDTDMLPSLFHLAFGDLVLHLGGYGFPALCGILAALLPALRRAREAGLPQRAFLGVVLFALLGGLAGAKLAAWLQTGTWSGRVLYGGLLGGWATLLVVARALGLRAATTADVLTPPALLAAAFGRLGCFFGGCCYGIPSTIGVVYPRGSLAWKAQVSTGLLPAEAPDSLATLPMPLLEAAVLLGVALLTSHMARSAVGSGRVLAVGGLLYASWRFIAEFGRGDHGPYAGGPLTFSQWISVLIFAASLRRLSAPLPPSLPPRFEPFRWGTAAQVVALLLLAALGSGTVGCSGRRHQEAHEKGQEVHGRARDKAKDYYRRAREEAKESCADDCARFCCELTCHAACDEEDEEEDEASPVAGAPIGRFRIPVIRPGERIEIQLDLKGLLNQQTLYALRLAGAVEALPLEAEAVPYRFHMTALDLRLGELRCTSGPGEFELRLDAQGVVSLGACTLDEEVMSVLKAIESLTPGLIQLPASLMPADAWRVALNREVWARDAQGHGEAKLSWNATEHAFQIRAWISESADGRRRIQWLVR